jgi:hypothetical protein
LIDGCIDLGDVFNGGAAWAGACSFIGYLSIEGEAVCGYNFDNLLPLGLPTAELFALLGQKLQGTRVEIEKRLILTPQGSEV